MPEDSDQPRPARPGYMMRMGRVRPGVLNALIIHAHAHQWCWRITCTTCGHSLYLAGLLAVAHGHSPKDIAWNISDPTYFHANRYPPHRFPHMIQRKLLRMAREIDLLVLRNNCDWEFILGSIGVLLYHCEEIELAESIFSPHFDQQLQELLPVHHKELIRADPKRAWVWKDLETIENLF